MPRHVWLRKGDYLDKIIVPLWKEGVRREEEREEEHLSWAWSAKIQAGLLAPPLATKAEPPRNKLDNRANFPRWL